MTQTADSETRSLSGRMLVGAMFAFGALATATLWTYWHLHMMPFMPLQQALVEHFGKDSAPRVEGGQRKIHKHTTRMLRVVMKVPFDPTADDTETRTKVEHYLVTVQDTAAGYVTLEEYDTLELHLFQELPEQVFPQITIRRNVRTGEDVNEDGTPVKPHPPAADDSDAVSDGNPSP